MSVASRADLARERVLAADATARQARAMEIFKASDAFLEGHFVYTSGRHGSAYLEKFRILERAEHRLAEHIGAVARVVVKRAAMKARDEAELYLLLSEEIEDKNERKAFMRQAAVSRRGPGKT